VLRYQYDRVHTGITTARQLLNIEGVNVRLLGGRLDGRWLETIGTPQEQGIDDLIDHTLFLGAQGVDSDLDIVDQSSELAAGKLNYARRARFIVFLADSSKWSNSALAKVMPLWASSSPRLGLRIPRVRIENFLHFH
jgi:DeoR/GlpR family transcriptional regulator of sugar metabolism